MEERKFEYHAHVMSRMGYGAVLSVSRLPEPGEDIEDWLQEECTNARSGDKESGLLHLAGLDDLIMVHYSREEIKPPPDSPGAGERLAPFEMPMPPEWGKPPQAGPPQPGSLPHVPRPPMPEVSRRGMSLDSGIPLPEEPTKSLEEVATEFARHIAANLDASIGGTSIVRIDHFPYKIDSEAGEEEEDE